MSTLEILLFIVILFLSIFFFIFRTSFLQEFLKKFHLKKQSTKTEQEIMEMIEETKFARIIDLHDKKLIESVLSFRDRIAREVMVPRVEVFSLPAETTIKKAASILQKEGFSRTPIYKNHIDNIVGILMSKDLLSKYREYEIKGNDPSILNTSIESIKKNVLFTPETKKLSSLLQEFRKNQVHLAIVVDEYGGTEGIVTIEDILEEIVGEILDEYDNEEALYKILPNGSWIVDAKMNILDIEEELNITIPQKSEYDTLGGFISNFTGTIPKKGFQIHLDAFEIEILSSNEKAVEKVKITPIQSQDITSS